MPLVSEPVIGAIPTKPASASRRSQASIPSPAKGEKKKATLPTAQKEKKKKDKVEERISRRVAISAQKRKLSMPQEKGRFRSVIRKRRKWMIQR